MVMCREVCPEGVQNKCPGGGGGGGGVWCRGFMSWGDTLILVISKGYTIILWNSPFIPASLSLGRSETGHVSTYKRRMYCKLMLLTVQLNYLLRICLVPQAWL